MKYRPEIDGLRAIAVLFVIGYHAEFNFSGRKLLEGGFLGVDIFFVISGYLITRIILTELLEAGAFNFTHFYERRARRILPMLVLVMLVTFPLAYRALLPNDFIEFGQSAISSILFVSNFFFYLTNTEYGADSALLKPLLHTWSLAIEEQFYILFPILLVMFHKALHKHVLTLLVVMFLASLWFSSFLDVRDSDLNFYLPMSRFWELLAGSLVAYITLHVTQAHSRIVSNAATILGLCLIAASAIYFDQSTPHPSYVTLLPVSGAALIIYYSSPRDFVGQFLGWRGFVGVGLLSYSAYLWHFPIFALARAGNHVPSNLDKLGWVAATFVLACASYFIVERPFRNRTAIGSRAMVSILGGGCIAVCSLGFLTIAEKGFPNRLPPILTAENLNQKPWLKLKSIDGLKSCHIQKLDYQLRKCRFQLADMQGNEKNFKIALLGDSHLASISDELVSRLRKQNSPMEIATFLRGGCPFYLGASRHNSSGRKLSCNASYQQTRLKALMEYRPDAIVVYGRYPLFFEGTWFDNGEGGIENTDFITIKLEAGTLSKSHAVLNGLQRLVDLGSDVVLVYPSPEVGINVPKAILQVLRYSGVTNVTAALARNPITTSYRIYTERTESSFRAFNEISHKKIHRIYPHKVFCNTGAKGRCSTHDNRNIFYADDDHLSERGAGMINELIVRKLVNIKRSN